jgi:hypothetical protein
LADCEVNLRLAMLAIEGLICHLIYSCGFNDREPPSVLVEVQTVGLPGQGPSAVEVPVLRAMGR